MLLAGGKPLRAPSGLWQRSNAQGPQQHDGICKALSPAMWPEGDSGNIAWERHSLSSSHPRQRGRGRGRETALSGCLYGLIQLFSHRGSQRVGIACCDNGRNPWLPGHNFNLVDYTASFIWLKLSYAWIVKRKTYYGRESCSHICEGRISQHGVVSLAL